MTFKAQSQKRTREIITKKSLFWHLKMKQSWYYWLLSGVYLSLMCGVQFFLSTFTSVHFVQMTLSSRDSDLQKYVFNDISKRLVLTGFYIYFLCGANSSSLFPSVISGEDLISFILLFTVQRALSSPSSSWQQQSQTYVITITQEAVSLPVFSKVQMQEERQVG